MTQLAFKWPVRPSYAAEDFIVSAANAEAAGFLESWPDGYSHAALISGPEACGKTHLATRWARRMHAIVIDRIALGKVNSQELWEGATHAVLEDIHAATHQTGLFHLLRHAETQGCFLLLTARVPAAQLHCTLADLRSRLLSLPHASVQTPDEKLLKGFLLKCFADRQLQAGEEAINYLLKRMERSFIAAHTLVESLEEQALMRGSEVTVPLVKSVLK